MRTYHIDWRESLSDIIFSGQCLFLVFVPQSAPETKPGEKKELMHVIMPAHLPRFVVDQHYQYLKTLGKGLYFAWSCVLVGCVGSYGKVMYVKVLELLSMFWFSLVFCRLAKDTRDNHKVAIKNVLNAFLDKVDALRILREIICLRFLKHANVRIKE